MGSKINLAKATSRRWLIVLGYILVASGAIHVFVLLSLGGQWEGPISWRKPILFGISTGVTMISLGWLLKLLPAQNYDRWLTPTVAIALFIEVALITVQQWRGEASHFNETTQLNLLIDRSVTFLVTFAAGYIFLMTWRCFGNLSGEIDISFAMRSGMVYLALSCLIGFAILFYGQIQVARNGKPELYGQAGVVKFPHGVAIHAIQFFPAICWLLKVLAVPVNQRRMAVMWASASTASFLLFSVVQTMGGRERFDLTLASGLLLAAAIGLMLPIIVQVFTSAIGKVRSAGKP